MRAGDVLATADPSGVTSSRKPPFEVSGNPSVSGALSTRGKARMPRDILSEDRVRCAEALSTAMTR
jgi:hypothetical protein